ncbi:MAG TPA: winged helix-turn-helix domain-containing protein [Ktedonobacteraceae bacterium]|nr:winged helix-turn-helix domain-containing protein [Ktedonobacteraceae bacterium]
MSTRVDVSLPLVLVAHHTRETVELLKALMEGEGYAVLCAYHGRSALQYALQHHPALMLFDQALPLIDGLELCRTLRQEENNAVIFLLNDHPDELGNLLAFAAGADECLSLPFHPRELLARIKAVLRRTERQVASPHRLLRCGSLELDSEQREVRVAGQVIGVTSLEYELLYVLLRTPGRTFSRAQLLELIPGFQHRSPFDRAVDIHISNLRRKLSQVMGTDALIETVRGVGYRLSVPTTETVAEPASPGPVPTQLALAAFERAPVPLLVLAADRTVVLYNEAARHLCGWSADQVVGQAKCYSLLSCHLANGTMLCREQCVMNAITLNRLSDQTACYSITLKDGREVPVTAHYSSLDEPGMDGGYTMLALAPDLAGTYLP